jgi:hypothetical protein
MDLTKCAALTKKVSPQAVLPVSVAVPGAENLEEPPYSSRLPLAPASVSFRSKDAVTSPNPSSANPLPTKHDSQRLR